MDADLAEKLNRRIRRIESSGSSSSSSLSALDESEPFQVTNDYQRSNSIHRLFDNQNLSSYNTQNLLQMFEQYDSDGNQQIDFQKLKYLMEKLGFPQTHVRLKNMIKNVDKNQDGLISFREFLSIVRQVMAENGPLDHEKSSLMFQIYAILLEIDVSKEGVRGAKDFFEAKISVVKDHDQYQRAIREEREEQRRQDEAKARRKSAFQSCRALFETA